MKELSTKAERSKYDKHDNNFEVWNYVKNRLTTVKLMVSDGCTDEQICVQLGISLQTLNKYKKIYPEFAECFIRGKEEVVNKLESKMYQLAMGVVDRNVTRITTKRVTRYFENPDTGEIEEKVYDETVEVNDKFIGKDSGDYRAIEFLLKNLSPEKYNVQPTEIDSNEKVVINDDIIPEAETKMFYDDSQDAKE